MSINPSRFAEELAGLTASPHFVSFAYEAIERWEFAQFEKTNIVEGIFLFLEGHETTDIGNPGPLVHFAESLPYGSYKKLLFESLLRKPTGHSIGMLNAMINGAKTDGERLQLLNAMRAASMHYLASAEAKGLAIHFLEYQS
ncbi:hypothetical protein [Propionivibrio sp.]|uniref:hypothetical protein n=1 Tax=Propionivibrio sp. TaxID=2212460 RepID=UPI0039E3DA47